MLRKTIKQTKEPKQNDIKMRQDLTTVAHTQRRLCKSSLPATTLTSHKQANPYIKLY